LVSEKNKQATDLNLKIAALEKELSDAEEAVSQWEASYDEVLVERNAIRVDLDSSISEHRELQRRFNESETKMNHIQCELDAKCLVVEDLQARLVPSESMAASLQKTIEDLRLTLQERDDLISGLEKRISKLETDHRAVFEELQNKNKMCAELVSLLQAAEANTTSANLNDEELHALREELAASKEAIHSLETDSRGPSDSLERLEQENRLLREEFATLKVEAENAIVQWTGKNTCFPANSAALITNVLTHCLCRNSETGRDTGRIRQGAF
jgi:chromosome segregation ATPase